jgi:phospholipid transport system transporter-binding protein
MPTLTLPETLTLAQASATLEALEGSLDAALSGEATGTVAGDVAVDASALKDFDSAALAVLLACRRLALAAGRGFSVSGAPTPLAELAGLYGIDELLTLPPPGTPATVITATGVHGGVNARQSAT